MNTFIKATTVAALSLCLSGPALAAEKLNIYAWAESIDPTLIEKFTADTGVEVQIDGYTSNEDLLAKLKAGTGGYDLVMPSQHFVKIMIQENLLKDIDADKMDAFKNVDPRWVGQWWDPENQYSIPFAYGSAGYTVNRDKYKGPVDSWKYFFEPTEDLKGKIAVFNTPDEVIPAAQNYLGISYCSEDSKEMKRVLDLLMKQKEYVAAYSGDNVSGRISSGEVAMHSWWDGDTMKARTRSDANIEYAAPKEGLVGWLDALVVPASAPNVENAKKFINFISEAENATTQENFYGHPSGVMTIAEKKKYGKDNAPELNPTVPVIFSQACSPAAQKLVDKVWTTLLK